MLLGEKHGDLAASELRAVHFELNVAAHASVSELDEGEASGAVAAVLFGDVHVQDVARTTREGATKLIPRRIGREIAHQKADGFTTAAIRRSRASTTVTAPTTVSSAVT